ncbi:MAG: ABC transporter permease [Trueperaceae bacterium]|nr:ABC transporter permease [Trueperaceae bacterium]
MRRVGARTAVAAATLAAVVAAAAVGPVVWSVDPTETRLLARLQPPVFAGGSWAHPLGTDPLGRDVLARVLYGARVSLLVSVTATVVGGGVGTLAGLAAGFAYGRPLDTLVTFLVDVQLALPFLLLAIAIALVFGSSLPILVALAALAAWPPYARVARGVTLALREQEFVLAARALGGRDVHVMLRHLLPNLAAPIAVLATLGIGNLILFESALGFLGIGLPPPAPSWGTMIGEGREYLSRAWWVATVPGAFLVLVTVSVGVLGDDFRDRLDVRTEL